MSEPSLQPPERDLPETPDLYGAYPRLSDVQVEALRLLGEVQPVATGDVLFRSGEHPDACYVVLEGKVGEVDGEGPHQRLLAVHGPRRFLGEISLLTGRPVFLGAVALRTGTVLKVPLVALRDMVGSDPALGDLILRAYLLRRPLQLQLGVGLRIIGSRFSPDSRRLREFAARNRIPHRWIDLEQDEAADQVLAQLGVVEEQTPLVIWQGLRVLRNPSNSELARLLGLRPLGPLTHFADLVVIGAGPAGLAAAVYGASEGLKTVVFDGVATGGQAGTSPRIENYLGFPAGISGGELAERAALQASKFGARIILPAEVKGLGREHGCYLVNVDGSEDVHTRAVVLATGAHYRRLEVPGIDMLEPSSVYYAATEAEANLCRGDPVVVVGGGNSAGQASLFLARSAASVTLVVRGDRLDADMSRYLADRLTRTPGVEVRLRTVVKKLLGSESLEGIAVEDVATGICAELPARALFVFIGAQPRSDWLAGSLALDASGFVLTGQGIDQRQDGESHQALPPLADAATPSNADHSRAFLETSWSGVYAAGDLRSGSIKRVASAVGEGAMSVRFVHQYLASIGAS
jgi:thioredoxin reductase (NADPH)